MSKSIEPETDRFGPLLRRWGVRLDADQHLRLEAFLKELELWNRKINLTGASSHERMVTELLFDSLLPTPFLPDEGTLLDVGSGGGFPAIPIKICKPLLKCQLIEPIAKKVHFLRQAIRCARLDHIEVVEGRMEEQKERLLAEGYDVITSRAFVPLPRFVTLCAPHLAPGGLMVAFLGPGSETSIQEGRQIMERHRLFPSKRLAYTLPKKGAAREILILKRKA